MRSLSTQLIKAVTAPHVRPFEIVELDFPDGPVRATSLPFDVTFDGKLYQGVSLLGRVSEITEGPEQRSYGATLSLSGIPSTFADYLAQQKVQGRLATLSAGFLNREDQIVGELIPIFKGRMDTLDVTVGQKSEVVIAVETLFIDWERPRMRRFTDADQKAHHPGDRGLEYVAEIANKEIVWGRY